MSFWLSPYLSFLLLEITLACSDAGRGDGVDGLSGDGFGLWSVLLLGLGQWLVLGAGCILGPGQGYDG